MDKYVKLFFSIKAHIFSFLKRYSNYFYSWYFLKKLHFLRWAKLSQKYLQKWANLIGFAAFRRAGLTIGNSYGPNWPIRSQFCRIYPQLWSQWLIENGSKWPILAIKTSFFCYICFKIQYKWLQMVWNSTLNTLMYCQNNQLMIKVFLIKLEIDQIMWNWTFFNTWPQCGTVWTDGKIMWCLIE